MISRKSTLACRLTTHFSCDALLSLASVRIAISGIALLCSLHSSSAFSQELSAEKQQLIRSLLSNRCFACHGPDADERKGGFRLDQGDSSYRAAESGKIPVVAGKPDESELLARMRTKDVDERMPPPDFGKALEPNEIALVEDWIRAGAPPLKHWSFLPPTQPTVPVFQLQQVAAQWPGVTAEQLANWNGHPIDAFVLKKQLEKQLHPSPAARRETLVRRLALDITGLPADPDLVAAYLHDNRVDATERVVDRLLASPKYGEHWARKWLDLARYADSAGYADDPPRTIWAYRDWVIRALNADMPLDQFTVLQLAGDLQPNPTEDDLIATAFHRNTLTNNEGGTNDEEFRNVAVVDRVNTTMAVWMGLTFNCAQCHTHKYDPFTQEEYFKIFAIFNQTEDADRRDESPFIELFTADQLRQRKQWQQRIEDINNQLDNITPEARQQFAKWSSTLQPPKWSRLMPRAFRAKTNTEAQWDDDGRITVKPMQDKIVSDTYTIELSIDQSDASHKIQALGLRTIPQAKLPGGGAGFGGGNFVLTDVRATWVPGKTQSPQARFVRFELKGSEKILSLAEVQVMSGISNVALKGKATQSSTYPNGDASHAIDGKTTGVYDKNSTTHTNVTDSPWWEVDLGTSQEIDQVIFWNRTDNNLQSRLDGVRVVLLDDKRQEVFAETVAKAPKAEKAINISGSSPIKFTAAFADYEQSGFLASGAIDTEKSSGWAVGGQLQQEHLLTLIPSSPITIESPGTLRLELAHESSHRDHLLGSFEIVTSTDDIALDWAQMNGDQRALASKGADKWTDKERDELLAFYAKHLSPDTKDLRRELSDTQNKLAAMKPETNVPIMRERGSKQQRETFVQLRGNYKSLGNKVQPGVPQVFDTNVAPQPNRLDLARWLTAQDNPLTARVMANRMWETLFGLGIVRTSEEFGSQGELPSHPELLDWLAREYMSLQWDSKSLLRQIVLSQTYQQQSDVSSSALDADSDNVWLARGPRVRLTAEMVRDQALAISGLLSLKMYGPSVRPPQPSMGLSAAFGSKTDWETSQGEDRYRRGLYTTWRRSNPYPSMATFDAPSREVCALKRDSTNTPLQALVTLNDPSFVEAAQSMARQIVLDKGSKLDDRGRLDLAIQLCTARSGTKAELDALQQLLTAATEQLRQQPDAAKSLATDPLGPLPANSDAAELAAWTALCNVLLNLDEVLMKP